MISGLNWERFPTVWLALGGGCWDWLWPKSCCSRNREAAFESSSAQSGLFCFQLKMWQSGFWLSHQPKHFHLKPHTQTCLLLVKWGLCNVDLPFTLPNQPEFLGWLCNRKELLGISSATFWSLNSQEFSTYCLSICIHTSEGNVNRFEAMLHHGLSSIRNKCERCL